MVHVHYDAATGTRFTPYAGFGVGWARNVSETEQIKLLGGARQSREDSTDNLAWSLNAGVLYRLRPAWDVEAGYRYINLGEVKSGPFPDGAVMESDRYTSHDILLSLIYRL